MMATVKENYSDPQNSYDITLHIPKLTNRRRYFIKQKALGLLGIISCAGSIAFVHCMPISLFLFIVGVYLLFTKQEVIY